MGELRSEAAAHVKAISGALGEVNAAVDLANTVSGVRVGRVDGGALADAGDALDRLFVGVSDALVEWDDAHAHDLDDAKRRFRGLQDAAGVAASQHRHGGMQEYAGAGKGLVSAQLRSLMSFPPLPGSRVVDARPSWWQSGLNWLEGFGVGVVSAGILSPFAQSVDGVANVFSATVDAQGRVSWGDSHTMQGWVDAGVDWLGAHTWDGRAYWQGAQWGVGTITVVGVVAVAVGVTMLTAGADIPVLSGLTVSGGAVAVTSAGTVSAGGAVALGGVAGAGWALLNRANGGRIDRYGDKAAQAGRDAVPRVDERDRARIDQWDHRPSDEEYLAHKDTFDDPRFYNQKTGERLYPPDRYPHGSVPGSEKPPATLKEGTVIDRYGDTDGNFAAPKGTPFTQRSLPPGTDLGNYHRYRITRTGANEMRVVEGRAQPWFNQQGGGTQYYLSDGTREYTIWEALKEKWIVEVK